MTLSAPIWLAAAASVVVPILIHLFGRPRPRLRRFPSLMLLRRAQTQRRSTTRLRRIISLILRCLALVLLAIVLAGPLSEWPPIARMGERFGATAMILDRSPSMAAQPARTGVSVPRTARTGVSVPRAIPMKRAREAALAVLEAVPEGEEVVFSDGGAARLLSAGEAEWEIGAAAARDRRAHLTKDIAALLSGDREIGRVFVFTDLQATSLTAAPAIPDTDARVIVLDVGGEAWNNSAVTGVRSSAAVHLAGRPTELTVDARAWGEGECRVPLMVSVDGDERTSAGIDLLPGATGSSTVEIVPNDPGPLVAVARLEEDALAADDERLFATLVRERLRVAVLGDETRTRFIEAALDPWPEGDPRSVVEVTRPEVLSEEANLDAVIASRDLSDDEREALGELAERGVGVMAFAGADASLLDALGLEDVTVGNAITREDGAALAEIAIDRPPLAGFADPGSGDLAKARFMLVPEVSVSGDAGVAVLARYDDGTPALLEGAAGPARTLLLATAPDDAWGDLVRMPEFVPLLHRLVSYLAAGTAPTVLVGAPGECTVGVAPPQSDLRVIDEAGRKSPVQVTGRAWRFTPEAVGAYRQQAAEEDIAAFAVNLDSAESDPARLSDAEVRRRLGPLEVEIVDADALSALLERLGPGSSDVSSLIALLALIVLAIESVQSLGAARESSDGER